MRLNLVRAMEFTLGAEGNKYHHVSGDSGGPTSAYGIILATAKALNLDKDNDGDIDTNDLKLITKEDVERVFKRYFWDIVDADNLPGGVDLIAADIAWNQGPAKFNQYLREGYASTIETLTARRKTTYTNIAAKNPTQNKFLKGWLNRANNAYKAAKECEV